MEIRMAETMVNAKVFVLVWIVADLKDLNEVG